MSFLEVWFIIGIIASVAAIVIFRKDGTTSKKYELYLAVAGVAFGIVTAIMIGLHYGRKYFLEAQARAAAEDKGDTTSDAAPEAS